MRIFICETLNGSIKNNLQYNISPLTMFFMFLVKLRHISAQVKVLFASADNNKKNQLKDSLRDAGKGHLKSLIFSLRQS